MVQRNLVEETDHEKCPLRVIFFIPALDKKLTVNEKLQSGVENTYTSNARIKEQPVPPSSVRFRRSSVQWIRAVDVSYAHPST